MEVKLVGNIFILYTIYGCHVQGGLNLTYLIKSENVYIPLGGNELIRFSSGCRKTTLDPPSADRRRRVAILLLLSIS